MSKTEEMIHFRAVNVCGNSFLQVLIWSHASQSAPNVFGNKVIALEVGWENDEREEKM